MSALVRHVRGAFGTGLDAWDRFFFEEVPSANAAVLRIAYGLVLTGWALSVAPDVLAFFSDSGVLAEHPDRSFRWSVLDVFPSDATIIVMTVLLVAAGICLVLGVVPRIATVVALVVLISFLHRNFWMTNSGDLLLRNLAFLLLFVPTGLALTLPQLLRDRDRPLHFPTHEVWPLRLIQIQISLGYLFTVWEKIAGETWTDGTAVSYALRIDDVVRFQAPAILTDQLLIVNLLTYGTLAAEVALAILVWNRKLRPWVLFAGVALHLGIDVFLEVGFFSYLMLVGYIAFIPPDRLELALRTVFARRAARTAA